MKGMAKKVGGNFREDYVLSHHRTEHSEILKNYERLRQGGLIYFLDRRQKRLPEILGKIEAGTFKVSIPP